MDEVLGRSAVKLRESSQDAKVDLKPLIVSVIPIYSFSETINLFHYYFFVLINKLITFSAIFFFNCLHIIF